MRLGHHLSGLVFASETSACCLFAVVEASVMIDGSFFQFVATVT